MTRKYIIEDHNYDPPRMLGSYFDVNKAVEHFLVFVAKEDLEESLKLNLARNLYASGDGSKYGPVDNVTVRVTEDG